MNSFGPSFLCWMQSSVELYQDLRKFFKTKRSKPSAESVRKPCPSFRVHGSSYGKKACPKKLFPRFFFENSLVPSPFSVPNSAHISSHCMISKIEIEGVKCFACLHASCGLLRAGIPSWRNLHTRTWYGVPAPGTYGQLPTRSKH
jgi:hypothetical protein